MEACRLRILFRNKTSFPNLLQRLRSFASSSSYPADVSPRTWSGLSDDTREGGSSVYRHALKFKPPTTIRWREELSNSVSFIGKVVRPVEQDKKCVPRLGAWAILKVEISPESSRNFLILLKMRDEMAGISIKHLKLNDWIYVSGCLHVDPYTKVVHNGKKETKYMVNVKEIDRVLSGQGKSYKKSEKLDSGGGETRLERDKKRLYMWQVFFANPSDWRDNRRKKANPKQPDFMHWGTGEALWINPYDPPWIRRQLELHDSRLAAQGRTEGSSSYSNLSPWVYDE